MQHQLAKLSCLTARRCCCLLARQRSRPRLHRTVAAAFGNCFTRGLADRARQTSSRQSSWLAAACSVHSRGFRALASATADDGVLKLVIYSRDDCPLCDGLKEKVDLALEKAQFLQSPLSGATVEVRDITTNPEWQAQYAMLIPVLKVVAPGTDQEVEVKRAAPRASSDRVAQNILEALQGEAAA